MPPRGWGGRIVVSDGFLEKKTRDRQRTSSTKKLRNALAFAIFTVYGSSFSRPLTRSIIVKVLPNRYHRRIYRHLPAELLHNPRGTHELRDRINQNKRRQNGCITLQHAIDRAWQHCGKREDMTLASKSLSGYGTFSSGIDYLSEGRLARRTTTSVCLVRGTVYRSF